MGSKTKHEISAKSDKAKKHLEVASTQPVKKHKKKKDLDKVENDEPNCYAAETKEEFVKSKMLSPTTLRGNENLMVSFHDKFGNLKGSGMHFSHTEVQDPDQSISCNIPSPCESPQLKKKKRKHKKDHTDEREHSPEHGLVNVSSPQISNSRKLTKRKDHEKHEDGETADNVQPSMEMECVDPMAVLMSDNRAEMQNTNKDNIDCFEGWSKSDLSELVNRMLTAVPKNDTLKYNSRVEKLNWDQVKFGEYNANDCKEKWKHIEKRLRGYRILEELLSDAKQWIEKPWTDFYRSGKKNRHPEMPKRPLTSYMLFYLDKKVKFAKKHPGLEMTSLSKLIAEKYKHLSQDKKDKYNALASNMREEYKEKMQKFLQDHPVEASRLAKNNSVGSNKKANVGMPGPVKPVPPFKLFLEDKVKHHKSDPDFVLAEFTTQCKNKWKTMSRKKKMPWIRWAHENELKYLEEVKLYKSENPNFEAPPLKSILSKEEKTILERMEGKPVKPPNSAYSLFSREMLNNPELKSKYETPKERMQEIAKLWKSVPKVEKNVYAEEVKRLIENYKMEYATYLDSLPEERREEELASNLPKRKPKGESQKLKVKDGVQLKIDTLLKKKSTEEEKMPTINVEELLAREPVPPPSEPFVLFRSDILKNGEKSEKKIKKAWGCLPDEEKEIYSAKLQNLKQQYFIDYKLFLTSMKPEELKSYSIQKGNPVVAKASSPKPDSDSEVSEVSTSYSESEEEDDDNSGDEITTDNKILPVKSEKPNENVSSSEDSSSSSSSSSDSD